MSSGDRAAHALISAPTQNAFSPAPVRITQRMAESASMLRAICANPSIISGVSALSFSARSSTTVAMASFVSNRIWLAPASGMGALPQFHSERRFAVQRRIHEFELWIDCQREVRLVQHIALKIDARRDFPHAQAAGL